MSNNKTMENLSDYYIKKRYNSSDEGKILKVDGDGEVVLGNIEISGNVDDTLSSGSTNPVQNRVIDDALKQKVNKATGQVNKNVETNAEGNICFVDNHYADIIHTHPLIHDNTKLDADKIIEECEGIELNSQYMVSGAQNWFKVCKIGKFAIATSYLHLSGVTQKDTNYKISSLPIELHPETYTTGTGANQTENSTAYQVITATNGKPYLIYISTNGNVVIKPYQTYEYSPTIAFNMSWYCKED